MSEPVLVTPRLVLRQIAPDDLDRHMAVLNTPAVMRYLGGVKPRSEIAAKHEAARASFAAEGFGFMIMEERDTGDLVGHCGLRRMAHPLAPNPHDLEIGWLVREDRWRRGYAIEAMRAVVDWGFNVIGASHLVAVTCEANIGSWRLMERLAMERRPELLFTDPALPPAENPLIQYTICKTQWEETRR